MGTIFNQPPRDRYDWIVEPMNLKGYVNDLNMVAEETGVDISVVVEAAKVLADTRRTEVMIADGDNRDEHAAGYAEILTDIRTSLDDLSK